MEIDHEILYRVIRHSPPSADSRFGFGLLLYVPVNSYGHVEMVSSIQEELLAVISKIHVLGP